MISSPHPLVWSLSRSGAFYCINPSQPLAGSRLDTALLPDRPIMAGRATPICHSGIPAGHIYYYIIYYYIIIMGITANNGGRNALAAGTRV